MKTKINNIDELKWEIARLTELKREQESYLNNQYTLLRNKVDRPVRVFSTLTSSIPGVGLLKGILSATSQDKNSTSSDTGWLTNIIRVGLPLVLNKTFLKNSSWLQKSLVMLLSDTAARQVTQENVSGVLSKVANFIRPKGGKKKPKKEETVNNSEEVLEDQILGI